MDVIYGINWKNILKRYESKIRIVTRPPKHYGFCCLLFYFEYSTWAHQLLPVVRLSKSTYSELAEKYNLQYPNDFYSLDANDFMAAQLLGVSSEIILFYDDDNTLYRYASHAFKFSEIKEDPVTMDILQDYLSRCDHQPSYNRYYMIMTKRVSDLFTDTYIYLRKATPEEIKVAEDLKTLTISEQCEDGSENHDKEQNTVKASHDVNNITLL